MFGALALGRIVHEEDEYDTNDGLRGDCIRQFILSLTLLCELYQVHEALHYDPISVHRLGDHSCKVIGIIVVGTFLERAVGSPFKIDWRSSVKFTCRGIVRNSGHVVFYGEGPKSPLFLMIILI